MATHNFPVDVSQKVELLKKGVPEHSKYRRQTEMTHRKLENTIHKAEEKRKAHGPANITNKSYKKAPMNNIEKKTFLSTRQKDSTAHTYKYIYIYI